MGTLNVWVLVDKPGAKIVKRDARLWVNAKSVEECATLALHQAARNGWRGELRAVAWTETMEKEGHAYALIVKITDNEPTPRPARERDRYPDFAEYLARVAD